VGNNPQKAAGLIVSQGKRIPREITKTKNPDENSHMDTPLMSDGTPRLMFLTLIAPRQIFSGL
jgi:hypothetical protein